MAQQWTFEDPVFVEALTPINLTWAPHTFNSVHYGNFSLNLWLLRADNKTDKVIKSYPSVILAQNHSVFNNYVLWTPALDDVDSDEVEQRGWTQLAWEETKDNPTIDPSHTSFQGWSKGFKVKLPHSSLLTSTTSSSSASSSPSSANASKSSLSSSSLSSSSLSSSSLSSSSLSSSSLSSSSLSSSSPTSSSPTSSSIPTSSTTSIISSPTAIAGSVQSTSDVASQSKSSCSMTGLDIGLGIAFGLLFLMGIGAAIWGLRRYHRKRKGNLVELPTQDESQAKYAFTTNAPYSYYKPARQPGSPPRELEVHREPPGAVEMPGHMSWSGGLERGERR